MNGVPVVSGSEEASERDDGPSNGIDLWSSSSVTLSTWLKLVLGNLDRGVTGVAGEGTARLFPSLESSLPFLVRSSLSCASFSPLCSSYFRIFFLRSSHAFSKAVLSYSEKGLGGSLGATLEALAGGGKGERGSSMGMGLA